MILAIVLIVVGIAGIITVAVLKMASMCDSNASSQFDHPTEDPPTFYL